MSVDRPIAKGDPVRTRKGAHFSGVVVVLYDSLGGFPHAVVEAVEPGFEGTEHLYPLGQLMLDEDAADAPLVFLETSRTVQR